MASILRVIASFFAVIFLSFLLSSFILVFSFSQSVKSEIIKPMLKGVFESSIPEDINLNESYQAFLSLCEGKESIDFPMGEGDNVDTLKIDCNKVRNSQSQQIKGVLAESMFDKVYYTDYNCNFLDCFEKSLNSPFLLSESANKVLIKLSYILLAIFVALLLLFSFIIQWGGIASVFLLNGLPFFVFFMRKAVLERLSSTMQQIQIFSPMISVFLYYFSLLSIISLAIGIVFFVISKIPAKKKELKKERKKKK